VRTTQRKPGEWATTPARRRKILDAALACFDSKGVAATTIEDICGAAGLSVGTIYHHFSGKDDICEHLVAEAMADYQGGIVKALEGGADLESSLRRLVRFHLGWVQERSALTRLMLSWEEAERTQPAGKQHYRDYSEALGGWLREQARAGRIRRLEPDLYSTLFMGPLMEHARQASAGLITASPRILEKGLTDGLARILAP
jgi:AcrR family transcriptional regulator